MRNDGGTSDVTSRSLGAYLEEEYIIFVHVVFTLLAG